VIVRKLPHDSRMRVVKKLLRGSPKCHSNHSQKNGGSNIDALQNPVQKPQSSYPSSPAVGLAANQLPGGNTDRANTEEYGNE
jgi:hypothetical protein